VVKHLPSKPSPTMVKKSLCRTLSSPVPLVFSGVFFKSFRQGLAQGAQQMLGWERQPIYLQFINLRNLNPTEISL
jgi:hypothetical protein